MNREELFTIARANGWRKDRKPSAAVVAKLQDAISAAISEDDLRNAPRILYGDSMRTMTRDDAVSGLLEELNKA